MKRFIGLAGILALFIVLIPGPGCDKEPGDEVNDLYGTWTDTVDGTVYRTLQIGDQLWMVDNINRGLRIDGTSNQENNGVIEKYCYEDNPVLCDQYGGLYQWEEAMQYETSESSRGICPDGWHIPSDSEWKILELFLGMPGEVAGEEFWRGIDHGLKIQPGGETGFEALRGGNRFLNGEFHQIGNMGYFWTSTGIEAEHAWRRGVGLEEDGIYRSVNHKSFGFSVRCVRY